MKRVLSLLAIVLLLISCGGNNTNVKSASENSKAAITKVDIKSELEKSFIANFEKRNIKNVEAIVTVIEELDTIKGFYFVQLDINDKNNNRKSKQFVISDGVRILPDVINLRDGSSLLKDLTFKNENYKIETSGLTLIGGDKNSKNIIVKISDFECPFCQKANDDLKKQLEGKTDYALYMMHLPLRIHKQAILRAKILEVGITMGKNFTNDLYHVRKSDTDLIAEFAERSGDTDKFKKLLESKDIMEKIKRHEKQANDLGISSTPVIFVNGKKINGFNPALVTKSIKDFK